MGKARLEVKTVKNLLFPYLPVLVGVNVDGKPNYITIGLIGWLCYDMMSVSVGHKQYSKAGIEQNGTFSINQPPADLVRQLDYCGLMSGRNADKGALFETFYGDLGTAPMIRECPINIECRVVQTIVRPIHTVFLGEVVAVHASEECLEKSIPDITRIQPIFYAPDPGHESGGYGYWSLGGRLGRAFEIGKELQR